MNVIGVATWFDNSTRCPQCRVFVYSGMNIFFITRSNSPALPRELLIGIGNYFYAEEATSLYEWQFPSDDSEGQRHASLRYRLGNAYLEQLRRVGTAYHLLRRLAPYEARGLRKLVLRRRIRRIR